jgi:PTS system mannose-specific IIA component
MIGLVIVSHGNLGDALIQSAEMILEKKERVFSVSVSSVSAEIDGMRDGLIEVIDEADTGGGVVVLTDLFGGTPSNLSISVLGIRNIEIIAGVNLPMLLKLLTLREQHPDISIAEASKLADEAGRGQISIASSLISAQV